VLTLLIGALVWLIVVPGITRACRCGW